MLNMLQDILRDIASMKNEMKNEMYNIRTENRERLSRLEYALLRAPCFST